jgi:hypothetical protein
MSNVQDLIVYYAVYEGGSVHYIKYTDSSIKIGDFVSVNSKDQGELCSIFKHDGRTMVVLNNSGVYVISDASEGIVIN